MIVTLSPLHHKSVASCKDIEGSALAPFFMDLHPRSKAAFITSLQTIVVATCCCLEAGQVQMGLVISSVLAVIGVGCLELQGANGHLEMTKGDMLCLGCPLFTGLAWFALGKQMKSFPKDVMASMAVQLTIFAVLFIVLLFGELLPKDGVIGIFNWCNQLPQLLQNPGVLGPLIFSASRLKCVCNKLTASLRDET